jgi:signal transduction histidine kinase/DNA-binding response OmpR family regulator
MIEDIFPGTSEMAQRMRELDWSNTALGPVERWPQSLRTSVSTCLDCAFPIVLWWGPDLAILYNDEYRQILGPAKHPWALGQRGAVVWSEIWDVIGPMLSQVYEQAEATRSRDLLLHVDRGYPEEAYFSFSYSPIHSEGERVGGIFCPVIETTEKVIGERRLRTLRDLAAKCKGAESEQAAFEAAARVLAGNPHDVPFSLIYLVDERQSVATLKAAAGIARGTHASPGSVALDDDAPDLWRLRTVARSGQVSLLTGLQAYFDALPTGVWKAPAHSALALPVLLPGQEHPRAVLVAAVSPMRALDDDYRTFFQLIATQLASGLADAQAIADERRRSEALAELDRAKTTFFSNVSHEFRTPLTLMVGPLQDLLAESGTLPADAHTAVEVAHRNGLRLLKLVNTLLDFSRIEAGRINASYEPTDLAALTKELASVFRSAIEKAGLALVVECESLPEPIYVDRDMWEKIVLNLLSNAFKFTFEGRITVALRWHGDRVELSVSDTGVGIPESDLPRVFERFHRLNHERARTHEGTGIGLALVQELCRLHGGGVSVTSLEGRGTTFVVCIRTGTSHLPAERIAASRQLAPTNIGAVPYVEEALRWLPAAADSAVDASAGGITTEPDSADAPVRVLVADDNADMRDYLCRILTPSYQVEPVGNGIAALAQIRVHPPDLVLADVMMPELDGLGLLAEVRADERTRSIPVILLSARAGEEARIAGLQAGADEYLVKPFSARALLARVASQLQMARLRREGERRTNAELERMRLLQENAAVMATLNGVGAIVASDLDRDKVVQAVTDAGTELTTAEFGAFFYNIVDQSGESYTLYTISGVPRETFSRFPMPRNTDLFEPTFKGTGVVRSVDVTTDPRYGHNPPYFGMPEGHLPVRSYLAVPVKGRSGNVIGGLFFGHSLTGRFSEHHERLAAGIASWASVALENARLYMSAQEANRIKDEFLASLSHELRTPLNAILGYARMLRSGIVPPEKQQKAIETIDRNATSLTQIVEDVLDVSRIVSGKIRLNVQPVEFPDIVRRAIDAVAPAAEAKGIRVETVLDPDAAPISGDPERLQQVLWNVLSNAVKFTNRGGKVQVRLQRVDSHVEAVVSDTGIGIPKEFLPHVFERFRQADAGISRERGGLGLGLAIARQLAQMHGGTIEAFSEGVDKGSTFRLKLPLMIVRAPREEPSPVPSRSEPVRREITADLHDIRVLAVDDDRDALALVAEVLAAAGAHVTTAHSAEDALARLDTEATDVIVADLGMPQMDGFQFIDRVRRHRNPRVRELPAAALTAYARSDDRVKALRAGFHIHLAKPIDPAELITTIAALARRFIHRIPDSQPETSM